MSNNIIKPTVGRVLWFYQGGSSQFNSTQQPFAASVAYVHSDHCVNIGYLDAAGNHNHATSVPLLKGDDAPPIGQFCMWMPYQKGQAEAASAKPDLESAIVAAGANKAPRVTRQQIENLIVSEFYFTAADGVRGEGTSPAGRARSLDYLTFCVLVLRNGFTVTGESACASPENFDAEIGKRIARDNAVEKVWPLEGYLLRQMIHDAPVIGAA